MSTFRRRLGWTLVGFSLLLYIFTVFCFSIQPDHFAAFTVLPIWLWGGIGLFLSVVAFYLMRRWRWLIMTGVWVVTLLVGADESRVLLNFGKSAPLSGPAASYDGKPAIRVITMNCAIFQYGDPAKDLAMWHPDIVLLQDALPYQVKHIADVLYGGQGDFREHDTNGVVTRWKIEREIHNPSYRDQQVTIRMADGRLMEVVNIHLHSAATDLRFWNRSTWTGHRINRTLRRDELTIVQQVLQQTTQFPDTPTLLGGDFNSPASDVVHRQLARDFTDAFTAVGIGWGDTFQRRFPILRIDLLYATRHLTPVRAKTVTTRCSDHRMVVADFVMR